ncbi:phosphatase PAP2 family protein [Turneriella parva]|uniref:Phosphoesterase PA-phosphatase related protein n=1 Tax=Turneriella parva (strain ATCC BAA-1111 / DSM 21527 / NCTC 11395 / H) TaxID=869212 RepID=I4B2D4_TURPD|nr:phosphatase PAP2 family protein [Turneriella parva]AFM11441.1 phosphoesterase PA-phosphatase related protein [Turneriella parva DSM 21527]
MNLKWSMLPFLLAPALFAAPAPEPDSQESKNKPFSIIYHPFQGLWDNSLAVFSLENTLYYHLPSVASTTLLVQTNWDYDYQLFSQKNNLMPKTVSQGMLDAGWYMPLVLPAAVYGWGFAWGDSSWQMHGASALQALGLTGGFTMALKSLTGRRGPDKDLANPGTTSSSFRRTTDAADFQFEFWKNFERGDGRFFWPSGHTSSTFALAASFTATTRSWVVGVLSYGLATTMGYAMIDGDHHWLSDVISGALLGHVVGWTVGTSFRNRDQPVKAGSWRLTPMTGFGYTGIGAAWYF